MRILRSFVVCLAFFWLLAGAGFLNGAQSVLGQETSLFKITLIVPEPNPARQAWAEIIKNSLQSVGIQAQTVIYPWSSIYDRALTPATDIIGKTFDQGGFDALLVGYSLGIDPDPFGLYHSSQLVPLGQNYYLWNDTENDRLTELIKTTLNKTERDSLVSEWQSYAQEQCPSVTILYTREVVAFDPRLKPEPFSIYTFPVWPAAEHWSGLKTVVIAQTGPAPTQGFNPLLTTSYYDLTASGMVFGPGGGFGLTQRRDSQVTQEIIPGLATSWESSPDGLHWVFHLRKGVKWHDGIEFTSDDVVFTFRSLLTPAVASPVYSFGVQILGSNESVQAVDKYTVRFDLPKPYAFFESFVSSSIIPEHVLKDVPYAQWRQHPFNTGQGSYTVTTPTGLYKASGPIGLGPYIYVGYDATRESIHLKKNTDYWDRATLEAKGEFTIQDLYIQHIQGSDAAVTALKNGEVQVLDSQYHLERTMSSLNDMKSRGWGDWVNYDAFGVQELGFNMHHPVFGTGVDTPLGRQDSAKAAEAARDVRLAISHLIPREKIIEEILNGFGTPGVTTPITRKTEGFNAQLQPHSFDINLAKQLLEKAGYKVESAATGGAPDKTLGIIASVVILVALVGFLAVRRRRKIA